MLFTGNFDVGLSSSYAPVAGLRSETSDVRVTGARVRLTFFDGTEVASFTSAAGATVVVAEGESQGWGAAKLSLIDPATAKSLRETLRSRYAVKTIIVHFRILGEAGGASVESADNQFLVDVCNGCLVSFPSDASTSSIRYDCSRSAAGGRADRGDALCARAGNPDRLPTLPETASVQPTLTLS